MRKTAILFFTTTVLACSNAKADETCGPAPFVLDVQKSAPTETIDRSLSNARLSSMITASSLPGYVTQGVTQVDYTASYKTEYASVQRPDGRWCSRATKVTVNFGFLTAPKIFIASGIPYGSCLYNEVLKHEYQHLHIAQGTLDAGQKWIDKALRQTLSYGGVVGPTPDTANAVIDKAIGDVVNKITRGLYATAKARNMALDTPANYALLGKACR